MDTVIQEDWAKAKAESLVEQLRIWHKEIERLQQEAHDQEHRGWLMEQINDLQIENQNLRASADADNEKVGMS